MNVMLNPRELITMAIQIEKNGYDYYTRMAARAVDQKIKGIFLQLAEAEEQHVIDFTRLQDSLSQEEYEVPEDYLAPEIASYLTSLADGHIFCNQFPVEQIAAEIETDEQALRHAISFEKDSIIFFHEIYALLPEQEPNRKAVLELIRQEKIHIARLYTLMAQPPA
jgi:rubrerythrin